MSLRRSCIISFLLSAASTAHGGTLTATPSVSAFGNVSISAGASTTGVSISSSGGGTQITSFSLGAGCAEFSVIPPSALPIQLGNNASMTVTLAYDPSNRTADSCTITPTTGSPSGTGGSFSATGDGIAPVLATLSAGLSFADQPWNGGPSQTLDVSIRNDGEVPIAATNLTASLVNGSHFSVGAPQGLPIGPGEIATIPITFDPTSAGAKLDTLTLSLDNDAPADPNLTVALSGTGIGEPPPPVPFTTSASRSLVLVALVSAGMLALRSRSLGAARR